MSLDRLETEIDLLQVQDGDTVVLRYNPEIHPQPDVAGERLREYFKGIGTDAVVLVMPIGMDLEVYDEGDMELFGWVRPERRPYKNRRKKSSTKKPDGIPGPSVPGLEK